MDKKIILLKSKRENLGWSYIRLGEKAGLSFDETRNVFTDQIYNETHFVKLNDTMDKALHQISRSKKSALPSTPKTRRRTIEYDNCLECGIRISKDAPRSLCRKCYNNILKLFKQPPDSMYGKTENKAWSQNYDQCIEVSV